MFIVRIQEGQKVRIGDRVLHALEVIQPGQVRCMIDGEAEPIILSWDRKLEILPNVLLTVKRNTPCFSKSIRLMFGAPRDIYIRELPYEPDNNGFTDSDPAGP